MAENRENIRLLALEAVMDIMERGVFVGTVLSNVLCAHQFMDKRDRAFLTRLVQGTVERCLELDYLLNCFSKVKIKKMKPVIRNILRISTYQILYMEQVPDSAACNEAVKLAAKKGFHGLKGFVNGVLRSISRQKQSLPYPKGNGADCLSVRYSVPVWLVSCLQRYYQQATVEKMLASQYQVRETVIRRKLALPDREFVQIMESEGCQVCPGHFLPYAYRLTGYDFLDGLPSFWAGHFTVQDESSMLAVEAAGIRQLLEREPKRTDILVLDICAAPGGKSFLAAEMLGDRGTVIARDISEAKTEKIVEGAQRLHINNIHVQCFDALVTDEALLGKADIVLADLPCSGLGVMGHKHDIKYHMTEGTIKELAALQQNILSVVWRYVRPGGVLIFSTCTVNPEENENGRQWILKNTTCRQDSLVPCLPAAFAQRASAAEGYLQLLQGIDGTDGFYIARFVNDAG